VEVAWLWDHVQKVLQKGKEHGISKVEKEKLRKGENHAPTTE
jgi:hypothetical protein